MSFVLRQLSRVRVLPTLEKIRLARLALSGALFGMAFAGTVMWLVGYPEKEFYDYVGGAVGALAVLGFKAAHIV
jgi:hypothetical protein